MTSRKDPFGEWREYQDHRYDPGYWTGGRVHPMYRRRSPRNPAGWMLIVFGTFMIVASCPAVFAGGVDSLLGAAQLFFGWICLAAGIALVQRPKKKKRER